MIYSTSSLSFILLFLGTVTSRIATSWGFVVIEQQHQRRYRDTDCRRRSISSPLTTLAAAGEGFGNKSPLSKTYDKEALSPRGDMMDMESAMREFFESQDAWKPLFRSMIQKVEEENPSTDASAAKSWLNGIDVSDFEFHETTQPWQRLPDIPTADYDREILAEFLDATQASLVDDIPVDETTKEDENDLQFLEEGRRMLVCSRFHVVKNDDDDTQSKNGNGRLEASERLFAACWNELFHLHDNGEADTGSLIVVPDTELSDLRRFVDMNLQRPLQWFGLEGTFEVASLQRGRPAIRVIHKLSDMPTDLPDDDEEHIEVDSEESD